MAENKDIVMKCRHMEKVYPGTKALDDVDFDVYRGKVNVLIGENGAGKSTLMKQIAGIEQPSSGTMYRDCPESDSGRFEDSDHGRADLLPVSVGGTGSVQDHAGTECPGHFHRIHLPPSGRDHGDWRPRYNPSGW